MNKNIFKKISIALLAITTTIYALFLILPFILSPILNSHKSEISQTIEKASGFKINFEEMQIITTPKLTAGLKIGKTEIYFPNKEKFLQTDNFQVKLSLLPILLRKIELDTISADNINLDLKVQKDGKFFIENYIPKTQDDIKQEKPATPFFKLSNHLPNIKIKDYKVNFIDMQTGKKYSIEGDTEISDFIINKKIKVQGKGKIVLDGKEQFIYDIKLFNKVMPNVELNELIFNPQPVETKPQEIKINIIDLFKALYKNGLTSNIKSDIKTYGTLEDIRIDGLLSVDKLSLFIHNKVKLPDSNILLKLKGNKIELDSDLYTAQNEITHINGNFKTGKKPRIELSFKSDAKLKNITEIFKSIAESFDIKELQTLDANGNINANFNIKSDLKKLESAGYFRIPFGNIYYGLYNIGINNINSDISLNNNIINIKNAGFSVLGQPLKVYGTIKQDAETNINVLANNLSIKSLLLSLGQISTLRENKINSGNLTLKATVKGKLIKPEYNLNVNLNNLDIRNIPSGTSLTLANSRIALNGNEKGFNGDETINNIKILNSGILISIPKITETITPDEITINSANVSIDKIKLVVSGKIKNYLTNKIILDITTSGNINSKLNGTLNPSTQKLNLNYSIPTPCMFPIPGFVDSKIQAKGDLSIYGSMANPKLKGTFIVPYILIPDMLVSMSDMVVNLNGPILKGNATVKKITSGGIIAHNLSSDFILKGIIFYLNNIKGEAFSGRINGNISYNVISGKTLVDFKGSDMNATTAILGTAGIRNALSGKLGFNTKITFQGIEYKDIVKSLKGNFSFIIEDGALGQIGRLENFLNAKNILANSVMRFALNTITQIQTVKDTAIFKYIKGDMTFSNGWANISSIKTSGPTMSYYVKGKYNILNGTTNVIVLGRLSTDVVALLGPIGDLSVDKLTSYIPKFGTLTAVIIKSMTTSPEEENIGNIPPLSSDAKYHKDFKVVFNGGIESQSSVKSFKWLSDVDTSAIDIKSTIKDVKKQFTDVRKSTVEEVKKQYSDVKNSTVNEVKNTVNDTKKQLQDAAGEWKDLLKF